MIRRGLVVVLCLTLVACSGGGGGTTQTTPISPWGKFRHDPLNSGDSSGNVGDAYKSITPTTESFPSYPPADATPLGAITSSPVIGVNHVVYVATEGGGVYALNPDLTLRWSLTSCAVSAPLLTPGPTPTPDTSMAIPFGPIQSSPALTSLRSGATFTEQNDKVLYFGDTTGHFFAVQDKDTYGVCLWAYPATAETDVAPILSSPTFLVDSNEEIITGIYFGTNDGRLYALNQDGSLKWTFTAGGAITSSPAVDSGGPLYFTAADGFLYAVALDGTLDFNAGPNQFHNLSGVFPASPLRGTAAIYVGTADGYVVGISSDASFQNVIQTSLVSIPNGEAVVASLALGSSGLPVPTATPPPTAPVTPTPGGPTPTPTLSTTIRNLVFALARDGSLYAIDESTGALATGISITSALAPTTSSPALSADGCLVFGDDAGHVSVRLPFSSLTPPPDATPTPIPDCFNTDFIHVANGPIRSSIAIDSNGAIYVGSDDGRIYRIGSASNNPS
ncbi:MAG: PQQ-binding-like beta-propeller repeat protein [Deltaproteobacteria bacterium]|nr:PQQ-binding-like beta-propeller repeat protein [Deltaproteobacteria bacterium]MBI3390037.1 PQQ-binding-like beta-propeller repeat protein [Deltaproteobacteria bacterium]